MCVPDNRNETFTPSELFGTMPVVKIRFCLGLSPSAGLPAYTGSSWRGLMGTAIQKLVCPFDRRPPCRSCTLRDHCPGFLLMEKKTPMPGLNESPRGYVVFPPPPEDPARHDVFVTLAGECVRFLPVVIQAVYSGRLAGIGSRRHPYEVISVQEVLPNGGFSDIREDAGTGFDVQGPFLLKDWIASVSEPPERLNLRWTTPVRLRRKGKYLNRMDWDFYFAALVRRLEALNCLFSGGEPLGRERWLALQNRFHMKEKLRGSFRWWDYRRYSNRQKRKIPMGGLIGEAEMTSPTAWETEWWKAAELLHVGKGTSMGLGRVEIF